MKKSAEKTVRKKKQEEEEVKMEEEEEVGKDEGNERKEMKRRKNPLELEVRSQRSTLNGSGARN